jgi:gas vesicle protein
MLKILYVIQVILKDRDGNNHFDVEDLKILKGDIIAITSIVSGLLLVIGSIPELKLKYVSGVTEEIIFKLLVYIFVVIIPTETGNPWTYEEKEKVVELMITLHQVILSSNVVKELVEKIASWFKKKVCPLCIGGNEERKQTVVDKHLPRIKAEIYTNVEKNRDHNKLQKEISDLRHQIEKDKKRKRRTSQ